MADRSTTKASTEAWRVGNVEPAKGWLDWLSLLWAFTLGALA